LRSRLDQVIEEWRPDHIHAHSPVLTALAALPVARRHNLPLLYEIRAFWEDAAVGNGTGREGSLRYRLIRRLETARGAAGRCGGGDLRRAAARPDRARHRCDKIIVSPNGVDLHLFGNPPGARPGLSPQPRARRCGRGRLHRLLLRL
jgi:glycosyltransferase involved in cell wall biosynthesis